MPISREQVTLRIAYWFRVGKFDLPDVQQINSIFPWLSADEIADVMQEAHTINQFTDQVSNLPLDSPINPPPNWGPSGEKPKPTIRVRATLKCTEYSGGISYQTWEVTTPWGSSLNDILGKIDEARKASKASDAECSIDIEWDRTYIH